MDENKRSFLLEEYKALRQEILDAKKDELANERNAILVTGGFWVWLLANQILENYSYAPVFVPILVSIIFMLKSRSNGKKFLTYRAYISRVESEFELGEFGWESYLLLNNTDWSRFYRVFFWLSLIVGNSCMSLLIILL